MTAPAADPGRVCAATGFVLVAAAEQTVGWRITKDAYVQTSGITGVLANHRVGVLPTDMPDRRGRYDTIGRTVCTSPTWLRQRWQRCFSTFALK